MLQFRNKYIYQPIIIVLLSLFCINWNCGNNSNGGNTDSNPPDPPSNPQATPISTSQIDISWTDNSDNEEGFTIERAPDDNGNPGSFEDIESVSADIETYSDMNLFPDTTFYYRVKSYNSAGTSDCTDIVSASTHDEYIIPEADFHVNQNHPQASDTNPGTEDLPFLTISAALSQATAGDTVLVRAGIYRESINLPSGDAENRFILTGAPGERVVVSGMEKVSGWTIHSGNIWRAAFNGDVEYLYVNGVRQEIAREPNDGWWIIEGKEGNDILDSVNLDGSFPDVAGAEVMIKIAQNNEEDRVGITSSSLGRLNLEESSSFSSDDKYWVQDDLDLIDREGEWASQEGYIYFWPGAGVNLKNDLEVSGGTGTVITVSGVNNVLIDGIEVRGGVGNGGINISDSSNVTVRNCVIHNNVMRLGSPLSRGINVVSSEQVYILNNLIIKNWFGILFYDVKDSLIRENEIAYNDDDGIRLTYMSDNILVEHNYVHHHIMWGHPDNIQVYSGADDNTEIFTHNLIITNNLLIGGAQNVFTEDTSKNSLNGNMIIGSGSYSVVFGHDNVHNFNTVGNTIAFSRYGCLRFTYEDYDVYENVLMRGGPGPPCALASYVDYLADSNLFYNSEGSYPGVYSWSQTLAEFQVSTGQDINSVFADPVFINAPIYFAVVDHTDIARCTNSIIYIADDRISGFNQEDLIEIDFDGIPRTIIDISSDIYGDTLEFEPALDKKPVVYLLVANWGSNNNFQWDLRLQEGSPGEHLASDGGPVGSTINIQEYKAGDFDGDGQRDIPVSPFN